MTTTTLAASPAIGTAPVAAPTEIAYALGRVALAALFIWSGAMKVLYPEGNIGYMKAYNLPLADLAIWPVALLEIAGGLAIALGFKARAAAFALIAFTVVASFVFHAYWAVPADQALNQQIHFMKNLAIVGALLGIIGHGNGRYGLGRA